MPRDRPLIRLTPVCDEPARPAAESCALCPSARPGMQESVVFGVIGGPVEEPRVTYLDDPRPVSEDILALAEPLPPTEVFRFAAPCAEQRCRHFDGTDCRLASRVATMLPAVTERLPRCRIRPRCRWWRQEGPAACRRCPQIVSETVRPTQLQRQVAASS